MKKTKKEFYFSFRSPYSWLAFIYLKNNYNELLNDIELVPFWEPDKSTNRLIEEKGGKFLYTPMTKEKHLYILSDIKRFTTMLNIDIKWPIDRDPWWELSHLPYTFIDDTDKKLQYINEIYSLRWEKGLDISSPEVIGSALESIGWDTKVIDLVDSPEVREKGAKILMKSYHSNVFGVPFFIKGNEKYWGLDRLRLFIESFDYVEDVYEEKNSIMLFSQIFEHDLAGGCG